MALATYVLVPTADGNEYTISPDSVQSTHRHTTDGFTPVVPGYGRVVPTINHRGLSLAYDEEGTGEIPVVLIHGGAVARTAWDEYMTPLSRDRRTIRFDLRGHGESGRANSYRFDEFIEDTVAVLDTLAIPDAVFVGHSLGGSIAASLASRDPDRVAGAFLVDPPLFSTGVPAARAGVLQELIDDCSRWQAESATVDSVAQDLASKRTPFGDTAGQRYSPAHLQRTARARLTLDPAWLQQTASQSPPGSRQKRDLRIIRPVRLLAADPALGTLFPPVDEAPLRERASRATVVRLEGTSHLMMEDAFDQVLDELRRFLAEYTVAHDAGPHPRRAREGAEWKMGKDASDPAS